MKKIDFLYFDGCPSYMTALQNLKDVLSEENIAADIDMTPVNSPDEAEKYGFLGSPSIRVDGRDLEGKSEGYSYSCRIYTIDGEKTGIPTKEFIREKIRMFEHEHPAE